MNETKSLINGIKYVLYSRMVPIISLNQIYTLSCPNNRDKSWTRIYQNGGGPNADNDNRLQIKLPYVVSRLHFTIESQEILFFLGKLIPNGPRCYDFSLTVLKP